MHDTPDGLDQCCPKCGAEFFHVVPGVTTQSEIVEFAKKFGWTRIIEDKWLHPGAYCPNGCEGVGYLLEYQLLVPEPDKTIYTLFLEAPGPNRKALIVRLHQVLGLSLAQARDLVESARPQLAIGPSYTVFGLLRAIMDLHPQVSTEPPLKRPLMIHELLDSYFLKK